MKTKMYGDTLVSCKNSHLDRYNDLKIRRGTQMLVMLTLKIFHHCSHLQ